MVRYKLRASDNRGQIKIVSLDAKKAPGSHDLTLHVTPGTAGFIAQATTARGRERK